MDNLIDIALSEKISDFKERIFKKLNEKAYETISKLRSHIYEISKQSSAKYIQKATDDKLKRLVKQGNNNSKEIDSKIKTRTKGIGLAVKRLSDKERSTQKEFLGFGLPTKK